MFPCCAFATACLPPSGLTHVPVSPAGQRLCGDMAGAAGGLVTGVAVDCPIPGVPVPGIPVINVPLSVAVKQCPPPRPRYCPRPGSQPYLHRGGRQLRGRGRGRNLSPSTQQACLASSFHLAKLQSVHWTRGDLELPCGGGALLMIQMTNKAVTEQAPRGPPSPTGRRTRRSGLVPS
ncbi:hypothetical protein VOLCADRAFT_92220 [Volvox carteri f. nagariensis]|uniref:Uncharacterized protein n=1 Tax=Volvox carteri f. nagariensis TaxID=3068 RepID=D8TZ29_VOLCA|nr:uncharacterized protein VOLCADRAFT_92220 [Volvox carteri f. nagariensis]EFJ47205.1 hypothetical protein VOLCADRAFT_92220 [Volvox carteri f. nagariensis]|eukprot:XP_002951754.1 hypothetical protein VOLCADRAFT_92220 [Volvox carteri f. nagariensis]